MRDNLGCTALHVAAANGNPQIVDQLCVAGADVKAKDTKGQTVKKKKKFPHVKIITCQHFIVCGVSRSTREIIELPVLNIYVWSDPRIND